MKMTLENGLTLDSDEAEAPRLTAWALKKGLVGILAFIATDPKGRKEYLLVKGDTPIFASVQFEAAAVHIDIMALDKNLK